MEWLDTIVENYPGLFVVLLVGANGGLFLLWLTVRWVVKRVFKKMEEHQDRQDRDIAQVKKDMEQYKLHFAVSQKSFDALASRIGEHIDKEDDLPSKVLQIAEDVAWIKGRLKNGS